MIDILRSSEHPPTIRFCIPDQWFRRKPRPSSTQSRTETDSSADKEGEGTAKQNKSSAGSSKPFPITPRPGFPEWRSSVAQSRLTSLLPSWSQPAPATSSAVVATPTGNRKSVSEPLQVQQNTGGSLSVGESVSSGEFDSEEFERCIVSSVFRFKKSAENLLPGSGRCQGRGEDKYAFNATREETTTYEAITRKF